MSFKRLLFVLGLVSLLYTPLASAFIEECSEEACDIPDHSASHFFLEDANDADFNEIDGLAAIPTDGKFWPVEGILTGLFGKWRGGRHHGHYHVGVDIAAPYGSEIMAPLGGTVTFVGRKGGYGLTIIIDHGDGIATLYAHNSKVDVSEGDLIRKGQRISKIGLSGRSTGPHLHYEVRVEGHPVNPLAWTKKLQIERS